MTSKEIIAAKRKENAPARILRYIACINTCGVIFVCALSFINLLYTFFAK